MKKTTFKISVIAAVFAAVVCISACSRGVTVDYASLHLVNAPENLLKTYFEYSETVTLHAGAGAVQKIYYRAGESGVEITDIVPGAAYVICESGVYSGVDALDGTVLCTESEKAELLANYLETESLFDVSGLRQLRSETNGKEQTAVYRRALTAQQASALSDFGFTEGATLTAVYELYDKEFKRLSYYLGDENGTLVCTREFDYSASDSVFASQTSAEATVPVTVVSDSGKTTEKELVFAVPAGFKIFAVKGYGLYGDESGAVKATEAIFEATTVYKLPDAD